MKAKVANEELFTEKKIKEVGVLRVNVWMEAKFDPQP